MPRFDFDRSLLPRPEDYYAREGLELKGHGKWRSALCPFHEDTRPSLQVHATEGAFRCMSCGEKGGDIIAFHQKKHDLGFIQAVRSLTENTYERNSNVSARTHSPKR